MKVIDKFIDEESFSKLKNIIFSNTCVFPWYYNDCKNFPGDNISQFVHIFFEPYTYRSNFAPYIAPILDKLECKALIRVKANLGPKTPKPITCNFHTDVVKSYVGSKTAVYYINTNNGYTLFKKGKKKVKSVENRIVIFDAMEEHTTVTQTDKDVRLVLNINYYP